MGLFYTLAVRCGFLSQRLEKWGAARMFFELAGFAPGVAPREPPVHYLTNRELSTAAVLDLLMFAVIRKGWTNRKLYELIVTTVDLHEAVDVHGEGGRLEQAMTMHGMEFARNLDAAYMFVHGEHDILASPSAAVAFLLQVCRSMRIDKGPEPRTVAQCFEVYQETMRFRGSARGGADHPLPSMVGSVTSAFSRP